MMTVKLIVKIDLSSTEDAALISRALCEMITNSPEYPELYHPDIRGYVIGSINDVEVTVR